MYNSTGALASRHTPVMVVAHSALLLSPPCADIMITLRGSMRSWSFNVLGVPGAAGMHHKCYNEKNATRFVVKCLDASAYILLI